MSSAQKNYNDHLTLNSPHLYTLKIGFHGDHCNERDKARFLIHPRIEANKQLKPVCLLYYMSPHRTLRNKHINTEQHEGSHHTKFS